MTNLDKSYIHSLPSVCSFTKCPKNIDVCIGSVSGVNMSIEVQVAAVTNVVTIKQMEKV